MPNLAHGPGFWATLLLAGLAREAIALDRNLHDDTLSAATRRLPKWAFAAGWVAFSTWFVPHIVRGAGSLSPTN